MPRRHAPLAGSHAEHEHPDAERETFERALAFARRAYATRDGTMLWGSEMPAGAIRRVALEAGERLAGRGSILRSAAPRECR